MKKSILFDLTFLILIKTYEIVFYSSSNSDLGFVLKTSLGRFPAEIILYFAGIYFFLPKYFESKNKKPFIFQVLISLFFAITAHRIGRFLLFPQANIDDSFFKTIFNLPLFFTAPFYFLAIPAIGFIIYVFRKLNKNELEKKEAEKQKTVAELNLFKAQIQPHFLFNTLNNLYSLSLKSSSNTSAFILKLSAIMEYMLYKASKETVPLELELKHIKNYVELEKLRYGNRLEVSWDIDKSLNSLEITPLLLFPFIENAFKHGASKDDENTWISISLKKQDTSMIYTVVNSLPNDIEKSESQNGGLGLINLTRRLELTYPERYKLNQYHNHSSYMAVLQLLH